MTNPADSRRFVAIVLAADRSHADPVAADAGTACKAIAPVFGRPMIMRVLDALKESGMVTSIVLCGPPEKALVECPQLAERIKNEDIKWLPGKDSPSKSVEAAMQELPEDVNVLLTTADHALLSADIVAYFTRQALTTRADACVGLVRYSVVSSAYPEVKRTVLKMSDDGYCSCNLFIFMSSQGRKLVPFWRQVEQKRKKPAIMVAGILGWSGVLMYLLGRLSLSRALHKVSSRLALDVKPVILPFAQAGVDVDTVKDRQLVEKILQA